MWDSHNGAELRTLEGHKGAVLACAARGETIVSGGDARALRVWDAQTGSERHILSPTRFRTKGHTGPVLACAICPVADWIVSGGKDKTVRVWVGRVGEHYTLKGHRLKVNGCAISPDGTWIVSASEDKTLRVWDTRDVGAGREPRCVGILKKHGVFAQVQACAISPDGTRIVSASDDKKLHVWDARSGEEVLTLKGHKDYVKDCAISPDGTWIVSASEDKTLKVWDAGSGEELMTLSGHRKAVNGCAVSPNGDFIVSASKDKTLKVWVVRTLAPGAPGAPEISEQPEVDALETLKTSIELLESRYPPSIEAVGPGAEQGRQAIAMVRDNVGAAVTGLRAGRDAHGNPISNSEVSDGLRNLVGASRDPRLAGLLPGALSVDGIREFEKSLDELEHIADRLRSN